MAARIVDRVVCSAYPDYNVEDYSAQRYIREGLSKFGSKVVAIDSDQQLTGHQLLTKIQRYAVGFERSGLRPECHVCAHLSNTVENLAAVLGVVFVGGTVVMAKPSLVTRELLYQIKNSECHYVLVDKTAASNALEARKEHPFKELFCIGDVPGFTDITTFQELSESSFEEYSPVNNAEEVVAILYTSGTTGPPKGVEASHKTWVSSFYALDSLNLMDEDDVRLAWTPITHISGFLLNVFFICTGVTTIFREPNQSFEDFVKDLKTYKVTALYEMPTKLRAFTDQVKATGAEVPRLKKVFLGGNAFGKSFGDDLREVFGIETLANTYALTEAFGVLCRTPLGQVTTDNVGVPAAGCKVKIVNPASGKILASFGRGEIWAHCGSVMKGYHKRPEETAAVLTDDGWLRTGDFGYYDDEGRLFIIDRLKHMIKCMDNQLSSTELEDILQTHDAVKEVAVIGLPSPKYGEAPAACVVLKDAYKRKFKTIGEELKQLIAGQTAVFKHLYGGVIFMDSLPKSDSGKILRQELKVEVASKHAASSIVN